jgi:chemotaxis protein MotB
MDQKPDLDETGGDEWLVSYADMMTLIACFFILMMAFANYDPAGFTRKAIELSKSFNKDKYKSSEIKMKELLEEVSKHPEITKKAKISVRDGEIVVSFSGSILFQEGEHNISAEALNSLDILIDIIKTKRKNYRVIIEGHSDAFEASKSQIADSAWELGAIRSAKVLSRFEYYGFEANRLAATTKGDSEPLVEEVDAEGNLVNQNLDENRRVVIKVLEPFDEKKKVKFGFGVYFND